MASCLLLPVFDCTFVSSGVWKVSRFIAPFDRIRINGRREHCHEVGATAVLQVVASTWRSSSVHR